MMINTLYKVSFVLFLSVYLLGFLKFLTHAVLIGILMILHQKPVLEDDSLSLLF